jgi:regulatory protein
MDKKDCQDPAKTGSLKLPVTITEIKPQKKRKDRFSLFHHEQFIIGVTSETLIRFGLQRDVEITSYLYEQIESEEQKQSLRDLFLRLLGRRDHSARELKTKAAQKGYNTVHADEILNQFKQKGYVDDEEFARKYTTDKIRLKQWGPVKIRSQLKSKGVSDQIIEKVIPGQTDSLELKKICVDLIEKRQAHFCRETDDFKRIQKISAYLQRKGFTYDTINRAMPDIIDRLNV